MNILAIETSCDETSVAVLKDDKVLSNTILSQHFHSDFGGVVPELASRAHLQNISHILKKSLNEANTSIDDIDLIAVTSEPGLMGALIVGANFAKGLALKYNIPIIPINHIEGHIYSGGIEGIDLSFPMISLVVSGGHTALFYVSGFNNYKMIGSTKDDAAGEAFDKTAKLMNLPYPGGPVIDNLAKEGNPTRFDFPRSMANSGDFNFSFSGLKTSVRNLIQKEFNNNVPEKDIPDVCASLQAAIVDILVLKTISAAKKYNVKTIVVGGGVSSNSYLRA